MLVDPVLPSVRIARFRSFNLRRYFDNPTTERIDFVSIFFFTKIVRLFATEFFQTYLFMFTLYSRFFTNENNKKCSNCIILSETCSELIRIFFTFGVPNKNGKKYILSIDLKNGNGFEETAFKVFVAYTALFKRDISLILQTLWKSFCIDIFRGTCFEKIKKKEEEKSIFRSRIVGIPP